MVSTGNLTVELEGRGQLLLRPSDHVATGGEASVYKAHGTSVKIYTDPGKMRRDGMIDKVKLLKPLSHKYVCAPEGVVKNTKGEPIGLYMPFAEGEALPRMFTTSYWNREGFTMASAKKLVERMRETMLFAHSHKAVMVDPNELNWIVALTGKDGPEPRAIDVDSWAIGRFGPKAIMLSVKDWHSQDFNDLTDWFAWGIVTFQIFTGIHPYRGTLEGYTQKDLEKRMKDNASVFSSGIKLNNAVRDFSAIPVPLLEWYTAVFQKKMRSMPPSPFEVSVSAPAQARVHRTVTTATGSLIFDKLFERVGDRVRRAWPCGVALTDTGTLYELTTKREIGKLTSRGEVVKVQDGWLLADLSQGKQVFTYVDERTRQGEALSLTLQGRHFFRAENRLFLVTDSELVEFKLMNVGKPLLAHGQRTQILQPQATKWFDGVGVQKAFGATFMVIPFGESACTTVRVKELDGITPITARAGNRFVTVVGLDTTGSYQKFEFTFSADYRSYQVWSDVIDSPDLNVAILPKGVSTMILNDGELVIFVPTSGKIHKVHDRVIAADMALSNWDDTVIFVKDGAIWSVKMK